MRGLIWCRLFSRVVITALLCFSAPFFAAAQTSGAPPTTSFTVNILAPVSGQLFQPGANINIEAFATGSTSFINYMALYAGSNQLVARVIDPAFPLTNTIYSQAITYNWTNVSAGTYALTAVAYNISGQAVTSAPVNIFVKPVQVGLPFVNIIATDPIAVAPGCTVTNPIITPLSPIARFTNYISGTNTATFMVRRFSPVVMPPTFSNTLTIYYSISGTASNGVDYQMLPGDVTIEGARNYALITVIPLPQTNKQILPPISPPDFVKTVILTLTEPPTASPVLTYNIGWPNRAGAVIYEDCWLPRPVGPVGPPIFGPVAVGPFHLSYPAANGMMYCVDVSTDMTNWQTVCTNAVVKGAIEFLDPDTCNYSNRFYRVRKAAALPLY